MPWSNRTRLPLGSTGLEDSGTRRQFVQLPPGESPGSRGRMVGTRSSARRRPPPVVGPPIRTTNKGVSMRVLVTGGTGFTGTALVRRLRASGHEVVALDYKDGLQCDALRAMGVEVVLG